LLYSNHERNVVRKKKGVYDNEKNCAALAPAAVAGGGCFVTDADAQAPGSAKLRLLTGTGEPTPEPPRLRRLVAADGQFSGTNICISSRRARMMDTVLMAGVGRLK
jgi:hypothetical protein